MFKGQIIKRQNLTLKKPGTGIKFNEIKKLIGKKLIKNVTNKRLIKYQDII